MSALDRLRSDVSPSVRYLALGSSRLPSYPRVTTFGRNTDGYDLGGEDGCGPDHDPDHDADADDFGDGAPGAELVRDCLLNFAICWQLFDIDVAASAFNIADELVAQVAPQPSDYLGKEAQDVALGKLIQLVSSQRDQFGVDGCRESTVAEVACLLNLPEPAVKSLVEEHYWMFLGEERDGSPIIEHEGE